MGVGRWALSGQAPRTERLAAEIERGKRRKVHGHERRRGDGWVDLSRRVEMRREQMIVAIDGNGWRTKHRRQPGKAAAGTDEELGAPNHFGLNAEIVLRRHRLPQMVAGAEAVERVLAVLVEP